MKLIDVFRPECISLEDKVSGRDEVLDIIAKTAKGSKLLENISEDLISNGLKSREELGSTGFGGGIAIPHCRLKGVTDFVVGVVVVKGGVEFSALDGKKVKLFVFIIAPDRESNEHIRILSAISQVLRIKGVFDEIVSSSSEESIKESFLRNSQDEVDTSEQQGKRLFNVFIQDEDIFNDILEIFSAMDSASVMVISAEGSSTYLRKTPLFASFLTDNDRGFNRIITSLVDKRLCNETIRRIEQIAGNLEEREDLLLVVQDIFYSAGRLSV